MTPKCWPKYWPNYWLNYRPIVLYTLAWLCLSAPQAAQGQPYGEAEPRSYTGLSPEKALSQFIVENWTTAQGLPGTAVMAIGRSADGYLWLGTFDGLVRFDGVRMTLFNNANVEAFRSNGIFSVQADARGGIWAGSQGGGLLRYCNGQFAHFEVDTLESANLIFDVVPHVKDGLFLCTAAGLYTVSADSSIRRITAAGAPKGAVRKAVYDGEGHWWFATSGEGVFAFDGRHWQRWTEAEGLGNNFCYSLTLGLDGTVWVGTRKGLSAISPKGKAQALLQGSAPTGRVNALYADPLGTLWIGGFSGLWRHQKGQFEAFPATPGLQNITCLLDDGEGSLWAGSYRNGLWRIKDGKFANYGTREGLPYEVVVSILAEDSLIWLGTERGLALLEGDQISPIPLAQEGTEPFITHVQRDRGGQLWVCTFSGLARFDKAGRKAVDWLTMEDGLLTDHVRKVARDTAGDLYIGTATALHRYNGVSMEVVPLGEEQTPDFVLELYHDHEEALWVGTSGKGLYRLKGNERQRFTTDDGLASNIVFNISQDRDGLLWVATSEGLSCLSNGRLFTFGPKEGLLAPAVFQVLHDTRDRLWLLGRGGVLMVPRQEALAVMRGEKPRLEQAVIFNRADGMPADEPSAGVTTSQIGPDGKLYVCTPQGLAVLNMDQRLVDHLPPPVVIEQVNTGAAYTMEDSVLVLPPGNKQLRLGYTGISLFAPEALAFEYRMLGYSDEWEAVGERREAFYTSLPPNDYVFEVRAANHDGTWSLPATLHIRQKARFVQTWPFFLILVLGSVTLGFGIYMARLRLLARRNQDLKRLVEARTEDLTHQKQLLERSYQEINDSLQYARRIQDALLPSLEQIRQHWPGTFVLYAPKQVVSGDFLWYQQMGNKHMLAVVDCTGHGVPGAFMAMLGNALLNQVVNMEGITEPADILARLNELTLSTLQKEGHAVQSHDGMDAALVTLCTDTHTIRFAGAKRPLCYIQGGKLQEIKGNRQAIGGEARGLTGFHSHELPMNEVEQLYLFSDGYADQFEQGTGRKFMARRFKQLLGQVAHKDAASQHRALEEAMSQWRGQGEQVDDILVLGLQLS